MGFFRAPSRNANQFISPGGAVCGGTSFEGGGGTSQSRTRAGCRPAAAAAAASLRPLNCPTRLGSSLGRAAARHTDNQPVPSGALLASLACRLERGPLGGSLEPLLSARLIAGRQPARASWPPSDAGNRFRRARPLMAPLEARLATAAGSIVGGRRAAGGVAQEPVRNKPPLGRDQADSAKSRKPKAQSQKPKAKSREPRAAR